MKYGKVGLITGMVLTTSICYSVWCQTFLRRGMCFDTAGNPPHKVGTLTWVGSYDHSSPQSCTSYSEQKYLCENGVGDPVTYGYQYPAVNTLGQTCTFINKECF